MTPIPRWGSAGGCSRSGGPSSAAASPSSRTCRRPEGQWAYRVGSLVVAANFTGQPAPGPAAAGEVLLTTAGTRPADWPGVLGPWEGVITRRAR